MSVESALSILIPQCHCVSACTAGISECCAWISRSRTRSHRLARRTYWNPYGAFKEKERKKSVSFCSARNSRGCFVRTRAVTEHDLRVENRAASEKLLVVRTSANMWLTQSSRLRVRAGQSHAFIHLCNRSLFLPFSPSLAWFMIRLLFRLLATTDYRRPRPTEIIVLNMCLPVRRNKIKAPLVQSCRVTVEKTATNAIWKNFVREHGFPYVFNGP